MLRLPADKRSEYHEQVDRLVAALGKSLKGQADITISRVVKAGSFAKYTILRKTSSDPVDVDVVVYISGRDIDQETFEGLNDTIYNLLVKVYPHKTIEDFEIQRKAATVTFVRSGLSVDVVPVIEDRIAPATAGSLIEMIRTPRPVRPAKLSSSATAKRRIRTSAPWYVLQRAGGTMPS